MKTTMKPTKPTTTTSIRAVPALRAAAIGACVCTTTVAAHAASSQEVIVSGKVKIYAAAHDEEGLNL